MAAKYWSKLYTKINHKRACYWHPVEITIDFSFIQPAITKMLLC
jgi:hypothetical protein